MSYILILFMLLIISIDPVSQYNAKYGSGSGPPIFTNIYCEAWDTSISDCTKSTFPSVTCAPQSIMGVVCKEGKIIDTR